MKKIAVIVAGGSGSRMGHAVPKQFLELSGKAILLHSVEAFVGFEVVVVVNSGFIETAEKLMQEAGLKVHVVAGGASRSDSVRKGLECVPDDAVVLVHDAARCCVTSDLIERSYHMALEKGSAIPVIPVADSVRMITGDSSSPLDRDMLRLVQTPQAFQAKLLKDAYAAAPGIDFSDDATVLEYAGLSVYLIEGEVTNIKITRPVDLEIATQLKKQKTDRNLPL